MERFQVQPAPPLLRLAPFCRPLPGNQTPDSTQSIFHRCFLRSPSCRVFIIFAWCVCCVCVWVGDCKLLCGSDSSRHRIWVRRVDNFMFSGLWQHVVNPILHLMILPNILISHYFLYVLIGFLGMQRVYDLGI